MSTSTALSFMGTRTRGQPVRTQNVLAASTIANIVKSSLGPVGLDKMLVDDVGDVTITNDGATILKLLDVEHPAGKVLVELAQLQDEEVGDGTTSVVLIAAELLKNADELVRQKIHPTTIIAGYRLACKEACTYIAEHLTIPVAELGKDLLLKSAMTSMSSKLIGADSEYFGHLVVGAAEGVRYADSRGNSVYPIKSINVLKAHGKSARESVLVSGYALNCTVASQLMPKRVERARIALLDFSLQKSKMKMGVQILVSDPGNLEPIRLRESDLTKEKVMKIIHAGANVVLSTGGIDDLCLKYFIEAGVMAVRRCKKVDLKRISKATGATLLSSLSNLDGDETFESSYLGEAKEVVQEGICDDELILIKEPRVRTAASLLLRGPNDFYVDEMERCVHDSLCVIKRVCESKRVVPGGGAVEAALSIYLENFATSLSSREQLAIAEFARSLLIIPKTLAVNAGKDATELVSQLRAYHHASQTKADRAQLKWSGLDLENGVVRDNRLAGVLEPGVSKIKSLKFATEAAITILRIDDLIKLNPENEGKYGNRDQCGGDYED